MFVRGSIIYHFFRISKWGDRQKKSIKFCANDNLQRTFFLLSVGQSMLSTATNCPRGRKLQTVSLYLNSKKCKCGESVHDCNQLISNLFQMRTWCGAAKSYPFCAQQKMKNGRRTKFNDEICTYICRLVGPTQQKNSQSVSRVAAKVIKSLYELQK